VDAERVRAVLEKDKIGFQTKYVAGLLQFFSSDTVPRKGVIQQLDMCNDNPLSTIQSAGRGCCFIWTHAHGMSGLASL
jgi:hypothetical protein